MPRSPQELGLCIRTRTSDHVQDELSQGVIQWCKPERMEPRDNKVVDLF